jgi:hypothetical protein
MVPEIWQKINAPCHSCHSWQESIGSMITAMTAIILLVIAVALIVQAVRLALHDGMGPTQPPRSHFDDPQFRAPAAG